ncbi:MAG: hypothetical protein HY316_09440 [Acidobacteria bacterium]|nr:hypothetical protein [Acidobacteriota bacterium]
MQMDEMGRVRENIRQYDQRMYSDQYYRTRVPELAKSLEEGLGLKAVTGVTTYTSHIQGEWFQAAFGLLEQEGRRGVASIVWK